MRKNIISLLASTALITFAAANEGPTGGKAESPTTAADAPATEKTMAELTVTDEKRVTELRKNLKEREVLPSLNDALAKLEAANKNTEGLYGLPVAIVGFDAESGAIDPKVYEGHRAVLATVGYRGKDASGKGVTGIKAIVIFPLPTLASFMGLTAEQVAAMPEAQRNWFEKIATKEASHVAFRNFRDATTIPELMNGAKAAPTTVEAYVTASTRDGDDIDTDTFDALWVSLRNTLKSDQPALHALLPTKPEVIKSIRSKDYATENHPELEKRNIFVKLGKTLIAGAGANQNKDGTPNPLDATSIAGWLEGRDTLVFPKRAAKEQDFAALDNLNW